MILSVRKKPVQVQAILWTGDNFTEVANFVEFQCRDWRVANLPNGNKDSLEVYNKLEQQWIKTRIGAYIIKGLKGEYYPCDPEVFAESYEVIGELVGEEEHAG